MQKLIIAQPQMVLLRHIGVGRRDLAQKASFSNGH